LALVQELARLHAGEVKVESVEGQGSTFRVTIRTGSAHLPREKVTHSDSAEPAPIQAGAFLEEAGRWLAEEPEFAPPARLSTRVGSLQRRIVLADDNADMRGYVGKLLTAEGFVVETAADGREALQMITRAQPDLVLSDVMMPQLNGFELLAKLRAQEKTRAIPVIMLSARAGEEARVEGLDAGADDYLIKPFSARELIARVNSQLQMARLRREGEERVTRIVESIRDGFQALDAQWRFTYINEAARQMMREQGLNPDEFIGKHFFNDAFPDVLGTRAESEFRRAVEQRIPAIFENYYAPWKRWFWVRAFPVQDGGISIFFQDIDDRKRQEEKLEELVSVRTKKLQATIADLEAFSYSVSHDLRSPLRAMQGYADELLKMAADGLSDEHRTYLQRIHRAASRLDLLTQEVLSYSKLARAEIEVAPLNLRKLVGDIIEQYPNLRESGALITVAEPLENVVGNDAYLTQALSNLLSNAVKFIPPGKRAEVRVSTERRGPFARIVVQDNGIGIDEKHRSRIFQIFGRVHPESKYPGTGVGLAIVKKAVEKMNGQAGFEPGEVGSRFWIELPAADTVLLRRQETPARVSSK
jgi:PAS domain S-box-containing protein